MKEVSRPPKKVKMVQLTKWLPQEDFRWLEWYETQVMLDKARITEIRQREDNKKALFVNDISDGQAPYK